MGKTKTAFVSDLSQESNPSGQAKYEEKMKKRSEAEAAKKATEKVHIAGLKGGQRLKVVEVDLPLEEAAVGVEVPSSAKPSKGLREPKVRSKKYQEAKGKIDKNKLYKLTDALKLIKDSVYSKFDETYELTLIVSKAGLSTKATLPHQFGKTKKIEIASDETIKKLEKNKIDFDVLLATADFMPRLVPFAKTLGPKGLMPNPKNGTLIKSAKDADLSAQAGKFSGSSITLKTEKDQPVIHTTCGKVSMEIQKVEENVNAIFEALTKKQIQKAYIKATMSPSVKIDLV